MGEVVRKCWGGFRNVLGSCLEVVRKGFEVWGEVSGSFLEEKVAKTCSTSTLQTNTKYVISFAFEGSCRFSFVFATI